MLAKPSQTVGEGRLDGQPRAADRLRLNSDLCNGVLWTVCGFQVDEDRLERLFFRQAAQQFPDETRLAHPPLGGQQCVGSVLDPP